MTSWKKEKKKKGFITIGAAVQKRNRKRITCPHELYLSDKNNFRGKKSKWQGCHDDYLIIIRRRQGKKWF